MNWGDFKETSFNRIGGIGLLADKCVCYINTQSYMCKEFRNITEEEYNTFDIWKDNLKAWKQIKERKVSYLGFLKSWEFRNMNYIREER